MKHHHHYRHDKNRSAIKEIAREQALVTQLRAIVLPALQLADDERCELVAQMFQSILDCSSKAMAELQHQQSDDAQADDDVQLVDDRKRVRSISDDSFMEEQGVVKPHHHRYQLKRGKFESMSLATPVPHYDGRQWRKYGQKHINKSKHPRSYYRCSYRQEKGCKATKTVQQQDDSIGTDHPVMFTVVYHGHHTCKDNNNGINSGTDDSETNRQSSISTICTDHGSNKPLDSSADFITRSSTYEPFDMAVFEPLDLDRWELDAFLRFGAS